MAAEIFILNGWIYLRTSKKFKNSEKKTKANC